MRIGLLRRYDPDLPDFLQRHGFTSVEIEVRAGDALDADRADGGAWERLVADLGRREIALSSLAYYGNLLDPDRTAAADHARRLRAVMGRAARLGVGVVGIMAGRDPDLPVLANIPRFAATLTPLVRQAEDLGVRLAIENCPKFHKFPFRGTNIGFSVEALDAIFDAVPSPNLGIEYDPSHPVMMFMDYLEWVYRYRDRVFHVHAKDAEVVWREIRLNGIYADGAFRYRLPGLGDVDWGRLISALIEIGYRGALDIEGRHDPVYSGDLEVQGLLLARRHLERFVPAAAPVATAAI
jgi:sugar phosphate isomerase/epimerase